MTNPQLEDHVVGLELQLVELVEQKERADVQGRLEDREALERQIELLQAELATTAEVVSAEPAVEAAREPEVTAPTAAEVA
jgi:hypothetical protein